MPFLFFLGPLGSQIPLTTAAVSTHFFVVLASPGVTRAASPPAVETVSHPRAAAPSSPDCSRLHPSESFPLRPHERAVDLECAASALGPLPPAGMDRPTLSSAGTRPPGFGIYNLQMTYDTALGAVLLLGATGSGTLNGTETWAFSAGSWTQLAPAHSPESCYGSVLAYDSADNYSVYLGGANIGGGSSCSSAGQTWIFQAGDWHQLHPTLSPSPRQAAAATNVSPAGYLLLFGGVNTSCTNGVCGDTWKFTAGSWTQLSPKTSPPARAGAGMTYDSADQYVVMFGGTTDVASLTNSRFWVSMLNDTWSFHGGNWVQLNPVGPVPPEPYDDGFVYDASDHVGVYTCADNNVTGAGGDPEIYWTFTGGNWTDGSSTAYSSSGLPPNRLAEALAYDWKDRYVVLFGGTDASWNRLDDTWSYHSGVWTNLTGPVGFTAQLRVNPTVIDLGQSVNLSVSIGGPAGAYTYAYSGLPTGCNPGDYPSIICSPTSSGFYTVTVRVSNATGASVNATGGLEVNVALTIGYFRAVPSSIQLGQIAQFIVSPTGGTPPYFFAFPTLPPGCSSSDLAQFNCTPARSGNFTATAVVNDSSGASATASTLLWVTGVAPPAAPVIRSFLATPDPIRLGDQVTYVAYASSSEPVTFTYLGLPPGCSGYNGSGFSCAPVAAGTYHSEVVVTDPLAQSAFANTTLVVNPAGSLGATPEIVSFVPSPAVLTVGGWTVLEVVAQGGVAPYRFAYSSLPAPCVSLSTASLPCSPGSTGNFTVGVTVTDASGNSSDAATVLIVVPASVPPSSVPAGNAPGAGPSWLDLGLAVLAAGLGVALVAVALLRPRPP
ncbi:MAG: hypothetical protein L3K19_06165 [Thermoplasmata archaeon]|nr:hypothetical protein [Thermoplasmata archaeon]